MLAAEPYGKQADKRKKEIAELETKVSWTSFCVCVCVLYHKPNFILIACISTELKMQTTVHLHVTLLKKCVREPSKVDYHFLNLCADLYYYRRLWLLSAPHC